MRAGFYMNGYNISSGFDKLLDLLLGRFDHQVNIQWFICPGTDSRYHRSPDGYLGYELPVHYVDMDVIGTGSGYFSYLLTESGKIG
jgi:hypothetical protein